MRAITRLFLLFALTYAAGSSVHAQGDATLGRLVAASARLSRLPAAFSLEPGSDLVRQIHHSTAAISALARLYEAFKAHSAKYNKYVDATTFAGVDETGKTDSAEGLLKALETGDSLLFPYRSPCSCNCIRI